MGKVIRTGALALPEPSKVRLPEVRDVVIPAAGQARRQIRLRGDLPAAVELCRQIEAFRKYVQDRQARDLLAAEARRTEVLIGKLLGPGEPGRPEKTSPAGEVNGVAKDDRHKFRLLADYDKLVEEMLDAGQVARNVILARIRRGMEPRTHLDLGGECRYVTDLGELAGQKFGCIYADPPWRYGNQGTRASTDDHYETMTVDEIAALPVGDLAADESHLWLWTTNGFLFECPRLFAAWGFEFKSSYVWVKSQIGIGNYLRNSHEFLLLGVRGGLVGQAKDVRSWGQFDRGRHSAKPKEVRRDVVEKVSIGPHLELFGRQYVAGWTVWGNEPAPPMFNGEG